MLVNPDPCPETKPIEDMVLLINEIAKRRKLEAVAYLNHSGVHRRDILFDTESQETALELWEEAMESEECVEMRSDPWVVIHLVTTGFQPTLTRPSGVRMTDIKTGFE